MIPGWLPDPAVTYLAHTFGGLGVRALARARGCHASTVMRQIRRMEAWREDPLIDEAFERMSRELGRACAQSVAKELPMPNPAAKPATDPRIAGRR